MVGGWNNCIQKSVWIDFSSCFHGSESTNLSSLTYSYLLNCLLTSTLIFRLLFLNSYLFFQSTFFLLWDSCTLFWYLRHLFQAGTPFFSIYEYFNITSFFDEAFGTSSYFFENVLFMFFSHFSMLLICALEDTSWLDIIFW